MTAKQLVEHHVLYCQSSLVSELIEQYIIEDDAIYEHEILEWWLITPTLARWLKEENEIVIEDFGCHWWGRRTSGQAIYLDGVFSDIVKR